MMSESAEVYSSSSRTLGGRLMRLNGGGGIAATSWADERLTSAVDESADAILAMGGTARRVFLGFEGQLVRTTNVAGNIGDK